MGIEQHIFTTSRNIKLKQDWNAERSLTYPHKKFDELVPQQAMRI